MQSTTDIRPAPRPETVSLVYQISGTSWCRWNRCASAGSAT